VVDTLDAGVGAHLAGTLDVLAQPLGDAADAEPRVQKPVHERRQRGATPPQRTAHGGAER
jgi:hypothetical protein